MVWINIIIRSTALFLNISIKSKYKIIILNPICIFTKLASIQQVNHHMKNWTLVTTERQISMFNKIILCFKTKQRKSLEQQYMIKSPNQTPPWPPPNGSILSSPKSAIRPDNPELTSTSTCGSL
ncbi:hypothetical protein C1H46_011637 [Malus baccata]|uniref:Uncharacterized protein n=1 Tax=Malus baccata TaxID=106549 RepID=A0A540MVL9_MALBA|nr:hypothetical protein C1H46_011637 [Malus baccata]